MTWPVWVALLALASLGAPLVVGVAMGADRQLNAALQRRAGPPLLQPLYDITKLAGKLAAPADRLMAALLGAQLVLSVVALGILATGGDLVVAIFVLGAGHVLFILAAASIESPYAQMGAAREIVLLVTREPLLLLVAVAYARVAGSSLVSDVVGQGPVLLQVPTLGITCAVLLAIALRKSPWDIASSHHAHQELVKGSTTEMAGRWLAVAELAHWYEVAFVIAVIILAAGAALPVGLLLVAAAWVAALVLDNAVPRATWRVALAIGWGVGGIGALIALLTVTGLP